MLYRKMGKGVVNGIESPRGETIEARIRRIVHNNEPITDSTPIVYTERRDGVISAYDIRTDKFDEALDAMDMMTERQRKNRQSRITADDVKGGKVTDVTKSGETPANSADGK